MSLNMLKDILTSGAEMLEEAGFQKYICFRSEICSGPG
jgi:hypothetical protein